MMTLISVCMAGFYGKDNFECALIDAVMDTCEQLHTPVVPIFSAEGAQKVL